MQTIVEEKLIREHHDLHGDHEGVVVEQEKVFAAINDDDDDEVDYQEDNNDDDDNEDEDYDDENEEEEFSFMSSGREITDMSLISADEVFVNGQIQPVFFPLFNQQLLIDHHETNRSLHELENLPKKYPPPVKKIFVQTKEKDDNNHQNMEEDRPSSSSGSDVISGPYCDLSSRKVVELTSSSSSSDACKKSNSTGFSKIWRFKDFVVGRSNSDGRDAFVFLSETHAPPRKKKLGRGNVDNVDRSTERAKVNKKKGSSSTGGGKTKTVSYSAHEVYLRSKVKEGDSKKRSSYLPYRPELMGFFTNVNGGLTKNVHPF